MAMDQLYHFLMRVRPSCHAFVVRRSFSQSIVGLRGLSQEPGHLSVSRRPREQGPGLAKIYFSVKDHPFNQEEKDDYPEDGQESNAPNFSQRQYYARKRFARKQDPLTPVLLTWKAREQIKYLFKVDPIRWSAENLAQSFPISVKDAQRLVRGGTTFKVDPRYIERHDKAVEERWKALKSGKGGNIVTPEQRQLFKEGKLIQIQSALNRSFPVPPPASTPFHLPSPPPGPFTNLIKSYISAQEEKAVVTGRLQSASMSSAHLPTLPSAINTHSEYHLLDKPPVESNSRVAGVEIVVMDNEEDDEPNSQARIAAWTGPRSPAVRRPIMHDQIKERIVRRFAQQDPQLGEAYSKWFARFDVENLKPTDKAAFKEGQKENRQADQGKASVVEQKYSVKPWEKRQKVAGDQAQHQEKISIPVNLRKENAIYRKGNSFYTSDGQFLYRVSS